MPNPLASFATAAGKRLVLVLLLAAAVRFVDLDWDQGHAFHPDERAIVFAVQRLSFAPLQLDPEFFAYGSLPFYLVRALTSAVGLVKPELRDDFAFVLWTGRALSAFAGVLTVFLVFRLGRRLYAPRVGVTAAFFLACAALHVQHSHFATSDVLLTLLIVATLEACLGIVRRGSAADHLWTGALLGLALATKVSAAPLLLPLALAGLLRMRDGARLASVARRLGLAAAAMAVAFLVGEPYAWIRSAEFFRQVAEQGAMVRHAGDLPYTIQYVGVTPFLYPLGQMVVWGMGPALGLAACWGFVQALVALRRRFRSEDLVLVAWAVVYLVITGLFEVQFPRYWLPVYPLLALWAAAWLVARAEAGRFGLLRIVTVGSALWLLAFLGIYRGPHTAVAASEWMYAHAPEGSRVLTQHWDEGFPLPLESGTPDRYRVLDFPYYDEDSAEKTRTLSAELAQADYVVLPTRRLYGAVSRVPERYPATNAYFRQLFAGRLGFELVHAQVSRPRLLGLSLPDELADESFSVYDHPRVLIFANTGRQSAEAIEARLSSGWVPALSRSALLLAAPAPPPPPRQRSGVVGLVAFAGAWLLLGLAAFSGLRRVLPPLQAWAASKVLGPLLFGYLAWLLATLAPGSFTRPWLTLVFLLLLVVGASLWRRGPRHALPPAALACEAVLWGGFGLFLAVRAANPAIFWGEKPMDFAFLNALARATSAPPPEPWFAGSVLHYTYFGHFVVAALGKLGGIHPAVLFNLALPWVAALTLSTAFGIGAGLAGLRGGLVAAVLTGVVGNLSGPFELLARRALDFDYFWATSRVVRDTINEYPLWSFLFADLHAHVLVLPFSMTLLLLLFAGDGDEPKALWRVALAALALGAIGVTSAWSVPTYALLVVFAGLCAALGAGQGGLARRVGGSLARSLATPLLAWALFWPFWHAYHAPERNWGWQRDAFVGPGEFARIFGLFLWLAVSFLVVRSQPGRFGLARSLLALASLAAMLASVRVGLVGLAALATLLACSRRLPGHERAAATLFAFASFVTAGCDVVFVWDRMNTLFKFYLDAWLLFAVASSVALVGLWRELPPGAVRAGWRAATALLGLVAAATGATAFYAAVTSVKAESPGWSLDGTTYLEARDPGDARALAWLDANVGGSPVIAEAWGDAYGDSARVSMNTGLPTVLGWEYHVHQRAQSWEDIQARKADLEALYRSGDRDAVAGILDRYGIALVYAGDFERRTYGVRGVDRLAGWDDLLRPIYAESGTTVYAVRGGPAPVETPTLLAEAPPQAPAEAPLGQLNQARGLAVASDGSIYVADFDNHRVQRFDAGLAAVSAWGEQGAGKGQFSQPCEVAVFGDRVYVADTWNQRVQVFDREGGYLREWRDGFYGARGLAVTREGAVVVADTGNHRVLVYDSEGVRLRAWGERGSGPGQFLEPMGVAVDARGRVYVADNGNGRLQVFEPDGRFLRAFPVAGWRSEVYSEPKLAIAPDGGIWATVPLPGVVRVYDASGALVRELAGPEGGAFSKPLGIAFDASRTRMLVTDLSAGLVALSLETTP